MSRWRDFYFLYPKITRSDSILTSLSSQMRRESSFPNGSYDFATRTIDFSYKNVIFEYHCTQQRAAGYLGEEAATFYIQDNQVWLDFDITEFTHIRREPNDLTCAYVFATRTNEFLTKSGFWVSLYTIKGSCMSRWRDFYFLYPKINRSDSILTSLSSQMRREASAPTWAYDFATKKSTALSKCDFWVPFAHNKERLDI